MICIYFVLVVPISTIPTDSLNKRKKYIRTSFKTNIDSYISSLLSTFFLLF